MHSLKLKRNYEEAKTKGRDNYDRDLMAELDRLLAECDRKVQYCIRYYSITVYTVLLCYYSLYCVTV